MTSRTCAAITAVSPSSGPRRTASSTAVHDVRPGSRDAITGYGQPGIICQHPGFRCRAVPELRPLSQNRDIAAIPTAR
jgi:hypothetical protein